MINLIKLSAQLHIIKEKIKTERELLHCKFFSRYKTIFLMLDFLVLLVILMNFGAIYLTNVMVTKTSIEQGIPVELKEVNPVQVKVNNYEAHPNGAEVIKPFLFHIFSWIVILCIYIYYRSTIITKSSLITLCCIVVCYFFVLGFDFWNNYGYYVGGILSYG